MQVDHQLGGVQQVVGVVVVGGGAVVALGQRVACQRPLHELTLGAGGQKAEREKEKDFHCLSVECFQRIHSPPMVKSERCLSLSQNGLSQLFENVQLLRTQQGDNVLRENEEKIVKSSHTRLPKNQSILFRAP